MGIQETHTKGCGVLDCVMRCENEVWEEMERRMVWCEVEEKNKGRGIGIVQ